MSATPSSVDICCSTSISPGDTNVSVYFPAMNQPAARLVAAEASAGAASCCYQRGGIIVRDPTSKTGPDPARSSILACVRPASCCYHVGGGGRAVSAPPSLLLSDLGGVPQRFLLLPAGGVVHSNASCCYQVQ